MAEMTSDEHGEIIEAPMASEVYETLPEPKQNTPKDSKSDIVKLWRARINVARKIRDQKLYDLQDLINFYEGLHWNSNNSISIPEGDRSTVNIIFANIKKELPYLYFQNPTPIVNETRQEFELSAFAMQELLKYFTKNNLRTSLKKHVRLTLLDAKFAFGTLKVSYTPRFGTNKLAGQPVLAGYDDVGQPIFVFDENGNVVFEPDKILVSELYNIERVSPREILIDPSCRNFVERSTWVGQEVVKPLQYLKDSPLYKNTEHLARNVELTDIFKKTLNKSNEEVQAIRELYGSDTELVRFVEIYNLKDHKLLVLPDNSDFFIREEILYMNPFSFLKFNESPDNFYPIPDIRIEKPLQQEINICRSMMVVHARRSARKYYYSNETFAGEDEEIELNKAKNPDDMTFFKCDYEHPPKALDMATQDPVIFQNTYQSRIDYNEVVGTTEMQRGVVERRKTKGEATFQEHHGEVRRGDKQSLVADFIVETYKNLAQLLQETLTLKQAIKIIGPSGIFWTQVGYEDIQGEFNFDIEVSEMRPQIPEIDRNELAEFIFALSNVLNSILTNPAGPMIFNIQGMVKEFAKSYPSINAENILNMKVTPEQIAQVLMMQLQQGGNKQPNQMQGENQ
jgi:hypothetical protein